MKDDMVRLSIVLLNQSITLGGHTGNNCGYWTLDKSSRRQINQSIMDNYNIQQTSYCQMIISVTIEY